MNEWLLTEMTEGLKPRAFLCDCWGVSMEKAKERKRLGIITTLIETFGFSPAVATATALFCLAIVVLAVAWLVHSAPPRKIVLTSGPEGSSFQRWALAYEKQLATHGMTLEIRPSAGSIDNLQRLHDAKSDVDIGYVQSGLAKEADLDGLMSLGSLAYQPLWVFYRGSAPISRLSELAGKRLAIGLQGSGSRALALTLLQANGITGAPTAFLDTDPGAAATDLLEGRIDAVFLMGDSAPLQTLRTLTHAQDVRLFNFEQADAYVRRNAFLSKMHLPAGSIDLGKNIPADDVVLVGPTVELIAKDNLNPAVSDLLLEVATKVHGNSGLLQKRGEFPAPIEHEIPLSDDAVRYYKSGKGFLYRTVHNFWLASLLNRMLVVVVPLILVAIPTVKLFPAAYRFSIQLRLYRCYRPLLRVERDSFGSLSAERVEELLQRVDEIEDALNRLKVPASFGERFYALRSHLVFIRERLLRHRRQHG